MWTLIVSLLHAHSPSTKEWAHSISLGYQFRTLVSEESFTSPHCSVLQYSAILALSSNSYLNAFVEPSVGIVGLNQSVVQPSVSMVLGFKMGDFFKIGSGPTVSTRDDQDNTFFPQILVEASFLLQVDQSTIPIKLGYVPMSHGLAQYQLVLGYTWH